MTLDAHEEKSVRLLRAVKEQTDAKAAVKEARDRLKAANAEYDAALSAWTGTVPQGAK